MKIHKVNELIIINLGVVKRQEILTLSFIVCFFFPQPWQRLLESVDFISFVNGRP